MYTKSRWQREKQWRDRNAQVVAMRLDKLTFQEIGDQFGISPERVRQIINRHMRMLRNDQYLSMAARRTIRMLLSEFVPVEVLRIKGVGKTTFEELKQWMAYGGAEFGGRLTWKNLKK